MKRLSALLCAAALTLLCSTALAADPPSLVGTWEGLPTLHGPAHGHRTAAKPVSYVIKGQKGHVFSGQKTYHNGLKKKDFTEPFSGTVSSEGQVVVAEHEDGVSIGRLRADGVLELQYAEPGKDAKAIHMLLKRAK